MHLCPSGHSFSGLGDQFICPYITNTSTPGLCPAWKSFPPLREILSIPSVRAYRSWDDFLLNFAPSVRTVQLTPVSTRLLPNCLSQSVRHTHPHGCLLHQQGQTRAAMLPCPQSLFGIRNHVLHAASAISSAQSHVLRSKLHLCFRPTHRSPQYTSYPSGTDLCCAVLQCHTFCSHPGSSTCFNFQQIQPQQLEPLHATQKLKLV